MDQYAEKDGPAVNFMQFDDALRRRLCAIERGMGNASPITRVEP
jgi:hypothetical protein